MAVYFNFVVIGTFILFFCDLGISASCVSSAIASSFLYKANFADAIIVGYVQKVDVAFPSDPKLKGMEIKLTCVYKGGPFNEVVTIGGYGNYTDEFNDCHENNIQPNEDMDEYIFFLRKKGDAYVAIFTPEDALTFMSEIVVLCGVSPSPPQGVKVNEEDFPYDCPSINPEMTCQYYKDLLKNGSSTISPPKFVTDANSGGTPEPTPEPKPEPEKTTKGPEVPYKTQKPGKTGGQEVNDGNGAAGYFLSRALIYISFVVCFVLH